MSSYNLVEQASKVIPNRFVLSKILTKRVRQLNNGVKPKVEVEEKTPVMEVALQEIIAGKIEVVGLEEEEEEIKA